MTARLNLVTYAVLGGGLLATWALLALAAPGDDDTAARTVLRGLWTALPYAVMAAIARWLAPTPARRLVVFAGAAGIAFAGVALLLDATVLRPDPRAAVTGLLLPAYQLVLAVAVLLVVSVLALRRRAGAV
jgi:hypothetical protein